MSASFEQVREGLAEVRSRMAAAAGRSGRAPDAVELVAVSKNQPAAAVAAGLACGQLAYGENRAQELVAKAAELASSDIAAKWHFVGRLQRNKVRTLAPHVECWHSIDRSELAAELARRVPGARALVQVNVSGEPRKAGCAPAEAAALVDRLLADGLEVCGLMTVPPAEGDPRRYFAALREVGANLGLAELSMGMSGDFEAAIEEGATIVRVGSAVFGPRRGGAGLRQ